MLLLAAASGAQGATPPTAGMELSLGHEELTSPLVRLSDTGPLLRVEGLSRLAGNTWRLAGSFMHDWSTAEGASFALSGHAETRRSPQAPDLDWSLISTDLMARRPLAGMLWGLGPTLQRLDVAGRHFRDVLGLQADVLRTLEAGGHWSLAGLRAEYRHPGDNRDFDSALAMWNVQRRFAQPLPGTDSLDIEAGVLRERNRRGLPELSSRSVYGRVALAGKLGEVEWSAGLMLQRSRFDASPLPALAPRRDGYRAVDLALSYDLTADNYIKLEANFARNAANLALYESRYRQLALTLGHNW